MNFYKKTRAESTSRIKIPLKNPLLLGVLLAFVLVGLIGVYIYLNSSFSRHASSDAKEAAAIYYQDHNAKRLNDISKKYEKPPLQIDQNPVIKSNFATGTDEFGEFVIEAKYDIKDYSSAFVNTPIKVSWFSHAVKMDEIALVELMQAVHSDFLADRATLEPTEEYNPNGDQNPDYNDIYLYQLGNISEPAMLQNKKVYLLAYPSSGMMVYIEDIVVIYDEKTNTLIRIVDNDHDWGFGSIHFPIINYVKGKIVVDTLFPEAPKNIAIPGQTSKLLYKGIFAPHSSGFSTNGADNNAGGIVYIAKSEIVTGFPSHSVEFVDTKYGPVYFVDNQYRIILEDGAVHTYELVPSFLRAPEGGEEKQMYSLGYDANIAWKEGFSKGSNNYVLGGDVSYGGCGSGITSFTNIVNEEDWFSETALYEVGKTAVGDSIYTMANPEDILIYQELFKMGGAAGYMHAHPNVEYKTMDDVSEEEKLEEYYKNDPIIFWKDHLGNWRMYFKSEYRSLAECGKPVIYLYPEETTDVRVEVEPNGGFTYTDPVYPKDGWVVKAEPNGNLYSYKEQADYPYLFWEGYADGFGFSDRGFVFSVDTLEQDMQYVLANTGLNKQEIYDFLEFWLPLMKEKPYVFVTFASQREFERAAPLTISPKPDSVLRVFMNFEPLDVYKDVEPLRLNGFERRGFTVVEWGGVLQR